MIKIVTDSTSDLPTDIATQLGISVVPVIVEIDGNSLLDGATLTRQQFYANLEKYRDIPKTAAPSPQQFIDVYRAVQSPDTEDVISIHLNRKFSGLCDVVDVAAREVAADGIRVHVINSETVTMGLGWLAITAAHMAGHGNSATEIISRVEALRSQVYIYAIVDTLKYLRKGGRANPLVAGIGDILQIKIVLGVHNGAIAQIDRIRTRTRGIARLLELAHTHRKVQHLSVLHTSNNMEDDVNYLQTQLSDLSPIDQQFALQVTPVIGAHVGPLALGVAMVADV
jgi:DegV family protein with EDD domain